MSSLTGVGLPRSELQAALYVTRCKMAKLPIPVSNAASSERPVAPFSASVQSPGIGLARLASGMIPAFVLKYGRDGDRKVAERLALREARSLLDANASSYPNGLKTDTLKILDARAKRKFEKRAIAAKKEAEGLAGILKTAQADKKMWEASVQLLDTYASSSRLGGPGNAGITRQTKVLKDLIEAKTARLASRAFETFRSLHRIVQEAQHLGAESSALSSVLASRQSAQAVGKNRKTSAIASSHGEHHGTNPEPLAKLYKQAHGQLRQLTHLFPTDIYPDADLYVEPPQVARVAKPLSSAAVATLGAMPANWVVTGRTDDLQPSVNRAAEIPLEDLPAMIDRDRPNRSLSRMDAIEEWLETAVAERAWPYAVPNPPSKMDPEEALSPSVASSPFSLQLPSLIEVKSTSSGDRSAACQEFPDAGRIAVWSFGTSSSAPRLSAVLGSRIDAEPFGSPAYMKPTYPADSLVG